MGLLDSLLSADNYGGLLGGLPASWQYKNPQDEIDKRNFLQGLSQNPIEGAGNAGPQSPFGPVPTFAQQPTPSIFQTGAPALASGLDPAMFQQQPQQAQPQVPAMPPAQTVAPPPQAAPQNLPDRTLNVGGYQMPQFGQPQVAQGGPSSTDFSAQSRQPQQPQELPPAFGGSSYLERLNAGGGLIGSLLGDTAQQKNLTAQYQAIRQGLEANGENPRSAASKAMIAVMNPEAAKTILPELFTSKQKFQVVSDNPIEGKQYGFVNDREQTINDKPVGAAGGSDAAGISMMAPGVKFDGSKSGDDYLNQFSPEVKAAVQNYIKGDTMPSGNPRQNGIANVAKTIAQKYGADMGIPVSDALYAEKRKYRTELGTNSPNSAGGQAKAFNQGISHMTTLADTLEKLDNSNGMGVPMIAQGVNAVRQGVSTSQSAISDEAKSLGQTVAGEVGKLFSGSAGGGVHERELTRERFDTVKSKPQLAAALRATLETMQGGLQALEQRRDAVLGSNSGVDLVNENTKANISKIQGVIDRLEGKSSSGGIPSGWSVKVR